MGKIINFVEKGILKDREIAVKDQISMYVAAMNCKIAEIRSLKDIELCTKRAEFLTMIGERDNVSLEFLNQLAETKIRIARLGGEIISKSPKNKGGRKSSDPNKEHIPTYKEQGISGTQAMRWRRIYEIPESTFEEYIEFHHKNGIQITDVFFENLRKLKPKSSNATARQNSETDDSANRSGEKEFDEVETESKFRFQCPLCRTKMTKLHTVKAIEIARKKAA